MTQVAPSLGAIAAWRRWYEARRETVKFEVNAEFDHRFDKKNGTEVGLLCACAGIENELMPPSGEEVYIYRIYCVTNIASQKQI